MKPPVISTGSLNCVRAGLCAKPSDYLWCSVGRYHQGGAEQAGVKIPGLLGFEALKKEGQRQKGFTLFVDHLAERGEDGESRFPLEHAELEALIAKN